jgi:hypothetical protein
LTASATETNEEGAAAPTSTITATSTKPTPTPTEEESPTPTATSTLALTPIITLTVEVQTIPGTINAEEGGGANLRQTPNGKYLMTLDNGTVVEIFPDFRQINGVTWLHVYVTRNGQRIEGWVLESVVSYATPEPNFESTETPESGVTPAP